MDENKLSIVATAVGQLSALTDTNIGAITDALIGICWDEEDAGQIESYHDE